METAVKEHVQGEAQRLDEVAGKAQPRAEPRAEQADSPDEARPSVSAPTGAWRDRAKLAETEAIELRQSLESVRKDLQEARESLEASERRQRIERELQREEAIDIDALSLLTQAALASSDATDDDIRSAVAELKRKKPLLFAEAHKPVGRFTAGPLSPITPNDEDIDSALDTARKHASGTGNRRDLLTYLRLKRSA